MASTPSETPIQKPCHLKPSPLGTKEYWESLYTTELTTHSHHPTDVGTIWFSDSSAEEKAIAFLSEQILEKNLLGEGVDRENCSFLDLGTGNGHLLFRLREGEEDGEEEEDEEEEGDDGAEREGDKEDRWMGKMLGVDYSPKSVEFARRIAASKPATQNIQFEHFDILISDPKTILTDSTSTGFDVVLDKGTFDAISLSEEVDNKGRRVCEGYRERVLPLVRKGGVLLVTSCNWTEEELRGWFLQKDGDGEDEDRLRWFEECGRVEYRSFRFGGKTGQTVAAVCFRRVGGK